MKFLVLIACLSVANAYDRLIIEGREARYGEYPEVVSLQRAGVHICVGTLVDKRTVVTAAHCFFGVSGTFGLSVVAGLNDLTLVNSPTRRSYGVRLVIIHPGYKSVYHYIKGFDVAILKLSSDAHIGATNIATVRLEDANLDINTPPSGTQCRVVGWGATDPNGKFPHTRKMVGDVKSISNAVCGETHDWAWTNIRQICAGGDSTTNSCLGDSGGPLFCTYKGKTVQVGIVSYGRTPCGQKDIPTVYTRVSAYRDFINENSG